VDGLRFSPAARDDLEAIFEYTVRQWGLEQAMRYLDVIEKACAKLVQDPALALDVGHVRAGYRRAVAGKHAIYFRAQDDGIAVIRILHQRMDVTRHL
jgi:toxin ParE1/3/4